MGRTQVGDTGIHVPRYERYLCQGKREDKEKVHRAMRDAYVMEKG
jgi:hypothetical protein